MLDPHPRAQLCFVIQQYGQVIITEPKRCKGMLSDLAPHHRLEINLLIAALEQKVAQELLKPTALISVAMQLDRLAQRLHDTVGIKEEFAYWAVESWALALNVIQQPMPKQTAQSIVKPQAMPAPKVAVTPTPATKIISPSLVVSDDAWLDELIAWADKHKIQNYHFVDVFKHWYGFPRDKQAILALTELYLSNNQLTELPESIGSLTNLTTLWLGDNQLTELPESIGKLTNLTRLNLSHNQLTKLPESIGKLTNLTVLSLSDNQLTKLPEWIGKLTNLTVLYLVNDQLTELPESIGNLINLTELYLNKNQLADLPESIGSLTNLTKLWLEDNQLTELPESIGKLTNLTWLFLSNNPIKSLSAQHSHLSRITKFDKLIIL